MATVLVGVLEESQATGKTMEVLGLLGYPQPRSFTTQLSRLSNDPVVQGKKQDVGQTIPDEVLFASYALLQQMVPGEILAPNQLAMGQTYEQLDKGQQGRLGARGTEDAVNAIIR